MTTLYYHSFSFIPKTGQEEEVNISFDTDDNYPHFDGNNIPPFHIFRAGKESTEFLVHLLWLSLNNKFGNKSYQTISPDIMDKDFEKKEIGGLNVSIFKKNEFNVVCTIVK